jgi:hypothetical protein
LRQSSFYVKVKPNKMLFPMICYTNIQPSYVSKPSFLIFDFVLLKMQYFHSIFLTVLCACKYYLKTLQMHSWDCSVNGSCEAFCCITLCSLLKVKQHFRGSCHLRVCYLLHTGFFLGLFFNPADGGNMLH